MQAALVLVVILAAAVGCSADCDSDVQEYMDGLATLKFWAMQSLLYLSNTAANIMFSFDSV
jgi:Tfp pilus assembly protein PilP